MSVDRWILKVERERNYSPIGTNRFLSKSNTFRQQFNTSLLIGLKTNTYIWSVKLLNPLSNKTSSIQCKQTLSTHSFKKKKRNRTVVSFIWTISVYFRLERIKPVIFYKCYCQQKSNTKKKNHQQYVSPSLNTFWFPIPSVACSVNLLSTS